MRLQEKMEILKSRLAEMRSVVVAFSGGVDSTFLLKVAHQVLGGNVIAVTAKSNTYPEREFKEAGDFIKSLGIRQVVITSNEMEIDGFSGNPPNRCYFCKKELFSRIVEAASQNNIKYVLDGSNVDDLEDYRPGKQALDELGILSPLREAGMAKEDIRILSRELMLPTWDKPAFACLASRFPYGHKITGEKLEMVDKAEQYLIEQGFRQVRVRHHGDVARIEVLQNERRSFFDVDLMDRVYSRLKEIGFVYVALDMKGYRTGSMNETLK